MSIGDDGAKPSRQNIATLALLGRQDDGTASQATNPGVETRETACAYVSTVVQKKLSVALPLSLGGRASTHSAARFVTSAAVVTLSLSHHENPSLKFCLLRLEGECEVVVQKCRD